jgi:mRNA interferase RelE/StbE
MKVVYAPYFKKTYLLISAITQKKFEKQISYLIRDIRHPSLRAKKFDETSGIWQARVDKDYRFYFLIKGDTYTLLEIKKHPK